MSTEQEYNRIEAYAQFNKLNKLFTTVIGKVEDTSLLNQDLYYYADIMIDLNYETVIGNYDNFQIVPISEQPLVMTEDALNELARQRIVERYSLEKQLTIIGGLLEQLANNSSIECEELKDMNDYIAEVKRTNQLRKEFYESNPDYQYLTTQQFEDLLAAKYEGGISGYAE